MTAPETFTEAERAALAPFFTNTDRHVFALTNLPGDRERGALRPLLAIVRNRCGGSSSTSSLGNLGGVAAERLVRRRRTRRKALREVFNEYGDDSVAQLGGAHIACEYVSNVLTKALEWGRLMAYLEQSTRYVPYTDKLHGRWRYHVPDGVQGALRDRYRRDDGPRFETYASLIPACRRTSPRGSRAPQDSEARIARRFAPRRSTRLRGMLPAATHRTSASTAPVRPTKRCSSACRRTRWRRRARAARRCWRSSQDYSGIPHPRRPAGSRRQMERVSRCRAAKPRAQPRPPLLQGSMPSAVTR